MKTSSKLIAIATLAVAVIVPAVSAQESQSEARPKANAQRGERGPGGRQNLDEMRAALNLDETQKPKFDAIMRSRMEKVQALRGDKSLSDEDRQAKMRSILEASRSELAAILTPEQKAKFNEMGPRNRRGGKGEGRPRKDGN